MIILCIGRREQGKTTLGYSLAKKFPTRVIFDPREAFFTSPVILFSASGLYEALNTEAEIIIKPEEFYPENFVLVCDQVRAWVRDNREEEFSFLIDEAYDVKTPEVMPPSLDWLMRKTKRSQCRIIFTAHRPVDISTDIRALADHWMIFQTTQEHDLKAIRERCGSEVEEIVKTLKEREFVNWNDSVGTFTKVSDPHSWYVSLGEGVVFNNKGASEHGE